MPPEIEDLNDYVIPDWPSTPEGEARQADEMVRHYRSLVSHPSVQAINYWGLTDSGAWLGAPIGLVRSDGSPKPSYDALRNLIKGEWWLQPTKLRTDENGVVTVSGFTGDYEVSAHGEAAGFTLPAAGPVIAEATLTASR
jgi:endo-1,4-beta-xylanase